MYRLTGFTRAWRNYLYANKEGNYNNCEDFITRVQLITDSHEQILENVLSENRSEELEKACLEEIEFQLENLIDLIDEFIDYYFRNNSEGISKTNSPKEEIIDSLRKKGTADALYLVADEWKDLLYKMPI